MFCCSLTQSGSDLQSYLFQITSGIFCLTKKNTNCNLKTTVITQDWKSPKLNALNEFFISDLVILLGVFFSILKKNSANDNLEFENAAKCVKSACPHTHFHRFLFAKHIWFLLHLISMCIHTPTLFNDTIFLHRTAILQSAFVDLASQLDGYEMELRYLQ